MTRISDLVLQGRVEPLVLETAVVQVIAAGNKHNRSFVDDVTLGIVYVAMDPVPVLAHEVLEVGRKGGREVVVLVLRGNRHGVLCVVRDPDGLGRVDLGESMFSQTTVRMDAGRVDGHELAGTRALPNQPRSAFIARGEIREDLSKVVPAELCRNERVLMLGLVRMRPQAHIFHEAKNDATSAMQP